VWIYELRLIYRAETRRRLCGRRLRCGRRSVVLGSGLGSFADDLTEAVRIPYSDIPTFPRSTAVGHAGQLVIGKSGDVPVAVMQGRVHLYEGYSAAEVAFPTRVLGRAGIRALVLTNAAVALTSNMDRARWSSCGIRLSAGTESANWGE